MVTHSFTQCNYCKTKILLRFQMGYFDMPFDICCPECGVHICGVQKIVDDHTLTINNASIIEEDLEGLDYYADFSVELPHAKTNRFESIESLMKTKFSPFMMTASLYEGDKYFELIKHMREFLSFRSSCWPKLTPLLDEKPDADMIMYEPPKFWEIGKMLKEKSKAKQQKTLYLKEQKQEFKNIFEKLGIEYSELSADKIDAYKRKWVDAFSPNDTDKKEIKNLCLSKKKYTPFLWHIFSFEILSSKENAEEYYNNTNKSNCVLISNVAVICRLRRR